MTAHPSAGEPDPSRPLQSVPTGELLGQLFRKTSDLLRKEVELAKAEIATDVRAALARAVAMVIAALFAIMGLSLFAAAAVLGLAASMPAWLASVVVGAAMFVVAAVLFVFAKGRNRKPLEKTRQTLKEDVQWAKEKIA